MTDANRQAALDAIAGEISACTRCRLHEGRTRAVPGEGSPDTEVMFVGEAPGFNEDRQGRPFVGQAGSLLGDLLGSVGWRRQDVFITNVVKCRPPGNRDPEPDEIAACAPFLNRQLEVLDPALVVTLGRFSMARFAPGSRIGQVHGTYRPADAASGAPDALCFAMYHPAAALHQGTLKQTLFDDMQGVPRALLASRERRESADEPVSGEEPGAETVAQPDVTQPGESASAAEARPDSRPEASTDTDSTSASLDGDGSARVPLVGDTPETAPPGAIAPPGPPDDRSSSEESDPLAQLTLF